MIRRFWNVQLSSLVASVVSFGKSIHQFISSYPLRMINSVDSSLLKQNALLPSWMEVNSGKSIHYSLSTPFTLKYCTRTTTECTLSKQKWFQTGQVYSSFSLQAIHSQILHENNHGMHTHQTEVISNWACLFIILSSNHSLSNTAREQAMNAYSPNRSDFKLGMSIHHFILWESLFNSNEA